MPLHQAIYKRLIEVAKARSVTYYSEIAPLAGLDITTEVGRIRIAQILDDINLYENDHDRPMLSSVVILKESKSPGVGFFECARGLAKYHGGKDRLMFWTRELEKVYECWQSQ